MIDPDRLTAYQTTKYIVYTPQRDVVLTIGERNPALDEVMEESDSQSAAFITAWIPRSLKLLDAKNQARQTELIADPEILAQRKRNKREKHRVRMAKYRARAKETVGELLDNALATVGGTGGNSDSMQYRSEAQSKAARTAQAILKSSLARHGITVDRVVRIIAEGLAAMRHSEVAGKLVSRPDIAYRLRSADSSLKLLERSGDIGQIHGELPGVINVEVLVIGPNHQADYRKQANLKSPEINVLEM